MSHTPLPSEAFVRALELSLPAIFTRAELPKLTGGFLNPKTVANMGQAGPPYRRTRRHALYEKASFLLWLRSYLLSDLKP
jgi:hypothetical protein